MLLSTLYQRKNSTGQRLIAFTKSHQPWPFLLAFLFWCACAPKPNMMSKMHTIAAPEIGFCSIAYVMAINVYDFLYHAILDTCGCVACVGGRAAIRESNRVDYRVFAERASKLFCMLVCCLLFLACFTRVHTANTYAAMAC